MLDVALIVVVSVRIHSFECFVYLSREQNELLLRERM